MTLPITCYSQFNVLNYNEKIKYKCKNVLKCDGDNQLDGLGNFIKNTFDFNSNEKMKYALKQNRNLKMKKIIQTK